MPHSCAFFAQEWDSTKAASVGIRFYANQPFAQTPSPFFVTNALCAGCRVPHSCAFFAQEWDSTKAASVGFSSMQIRPTFTPFITNALSLASTPEGAPSLSRFLRQGGDFDVLSPRPFLRVLRPRVALHESRQRRIFLLCSPDSSQTRCVPHHRRPHTNCATIDLIRDSSELRREVESLVFR